MTIAEKLRDMAQESKLNRQRAKSFMKGGDELITETGAIQENGRNVGQLQIIQGEEGRRVQLYNISGVYLCECPFDGDDDRGLEIGMAMYRGYHAGWVNADYSFSKSIHAAITARQPLEI